MIFLTGATGLLGSHILSALRGEGHSVAALVRSRAGANEVTARGATAVLGRVEDPNTWNQLSDCSGIIHSAAIIAGRYPWETYFQVNVEGARLAGERARQLRVPLVHISSVAVYGRKTGAGTITESRTWGALRLADYYARSKRMAEDALWQEAGKGLHLVIVRPCVVYGEGDRLFFPSMARAMRRGWVPFIGSGDRPLSLVYAGNVAQVVLLAMMTPAARGEVYNVTNDGVITAREFTEAFGVGLGRRIRHVRLPVWPLLSIAWMIDQIRRLTLPARYPGSLGTAVRFWRGGNSYSSEKAVRDLGWVPASRHRDAIVRTVHSLSSRQSGS
ncbi:MAG: NAD-dependent epimerase/dehydratase family protein [Gemmatimonadota bacterium]